MRNHRLIAVAALALAACSKSGSGGGADRAQASGTFPARKAGLWVQSLRRDGAPNPMGKISMCIDAATDAKITMLGHRVGGQPCRRTVARQSGGGYAFTIVCDMGHAGVMSSQGTASGDFKTVYRVRSEVTVTGSDLPPLNGRHLVEAEVRYAGACPANMAPGDVTMGGVGRFNLGGFTKVAQALGAGA